MAKLDKIKFARVIAHCISNGMSAGQYEVETLDELIDVETPEPQTVYSSNENIEALMKCMACGTNKIDAIREHRRLTGMGLKESKDIVEKYWYVSGFNKQQLKDKMNEYCKSQNTFADVEDNINNFINWCF